MSSEGESSHVRQQLNTNPVTPPRSFSASVNLTTPAVTRSQFLMNDIPRGTTRMTLVNYLLAPPHWPVAATLPGTLQVPVQIDCEIIDSRLDDQQSVATLEFTQTPQWLQITTLDPTGFPKKTPHGTIWRGVDLTARDADGRTEFFRAAIADDLLYAEALAEFATTDVNVQDINGRTALHWASEKGLATIVVLCLSVPDCDVGLRDNDNHTAFDLGQRHDNDLIGCVFYQSIFELEQVDPQAALLRILTLSAVSASASEKPEFPGAAMFEPALAGNCALVEALIARGVDLSATDSDGKTALHVAAAQVGNAEVVRKLLEAGADVHATTPGGTTALQDAFDEDTVAVLQQWEARATGRRSADVSSTLDSSANAKEKARDGEQPLPADDLEFVDERGWTALHRSVFTGDTTQLADLINHGVDLEVAAANGETALHFAARAGNNAALTILLAQGVNVEPTNDQLYTPLHIAAWNGHGEAVSSLLAHGADIYARIIGGQTALHLAAGANRYDTVGVLLSHGANVEAQDRRSWTTLHLSAAQGHTQVVPVLMAHAAKLEAATSEGETPLHVATQYRQVEMVKVLMAQGAYVDATRNNGWTALHIAAGKGHTDLVTVLVASGANLEAYTQRRETPLHVATLGRQKQMVEMLLTCGAKIEARSADGTALQIARAWAYKDIADVLLARGARTATGRFRHALGRTFNFED